MLAPAPVLVERADFGTASANDGDVMGIDAQVVTRLQCCDIG